MSRRSTRFTTSSGLWALCGALVVLWWTRPAEIVIPERPVPVQVPAWPDLVQVGDAGRAWQVANDTISGWVSGLFGEVGGLLGAVFTWLVGGLFDVLTFIGNGVVNIGRSGIDFTVSMFGAVIPLINEGLQDVVALSGTVLDQLTALEGNIGDIAIRVEGLLNQQLGEVYRILRDEIGGAIDGFEAILPGLVGAIVRPAIEGLEAEIGRVIDGLDGLVQDAIDGLDLQRLVADALAAAGIVGAVTGLLEWVESCGEPTCQLVGPKTDLGKLLQRLAPVLALLAGLELANVTEADLERIARAFGAISEGSAEDFFRTFIKGGGTLAGAGGEIVGEISDAGREALRALGIPVP